MKKQTYIYFFIATISLLVSACAPVAVVKTSSGKNLKWEQFSSQMDLIGAKYVVVSKHGLTKEWSIANISSERPQKVMANQEVIIFDSSLSKYSVALNNYAGIQYYKNRYDVTYGAGNNHPYFICAGVETPKTEQYTPCNTAFTYKFFPQEVYVLYSKGQMSDATYQAWTRQTSSWISLDDPAWLISRLNIVKAIEELSTKQSTRST